MRVTDGTSLALPLIAEEVVRIARKEGPMAVSPRVHRQGERSDSVHFIIRSARP